MSYVSPSLVKHALFIEGGGGRQYSVSFVLKIVWFFFFFCCPCSVLIMDSPVNPVPWPMIPNSSLLPLAPNQEWSRCILCEHLWSYCNPQHNQGMLLDPTSEENRMNSVTDLWSAFSFWICSVCYELWLIQISGLNGKQLFLKIVVYLLDFLK